MAERLLSLVSKRPSGAAGREILRLLGRLLGEAIREQHGGPAFDRVEGLRQHVVKEHRQGRSAVTLIRQLGHLPARDLVLLTRAFAIFAELANIADDYLVRCQTESEDQSPLERLKSHPEMTPERIYAYLAGALIAPVITAHPTEVRRKSIIDREAAIADLLPAYDHYASSKTKRAEIETQLKREIRILWQTRMLRPARIPVTDEIENAASIFARTFIPQLPMVKRRLAGVFGLEGPLPPCLRVGSWVGGDRDGNPFVSAATLDYAVRRLAELAFDHYLEQIHALGAELSLSDELVPVSKAVSGSCGEKPACLGAQGRRTLPARPHPQLRASLGRPQGAAWPAAGARASPRGGALSIRSGIGRRSWRGRELAGAERKRRPRRRTARRIARGGAELRLSSRGDGPQAELRRP